MTFRDFNDEGPGTFEWDFVLGGNTTGLFPEETHYEVDGNTILEVIFRHTGGDKFEPIYGDSWNMYHKTINSVPDPIRIHPIIDLIVNSSCRKTKASISVMTTDNLSIGTTFEASPICKAL